MVDSTLAAVYSVATGSGFANLAGTALIGLIAINA